MALATTRADVVVMGGGAAGVAAAMSAADNGASVILLERGNLLGGELVGGLPILSVANVRGDWIVGGPARQLLDRADSLGGYAGRPFDGRAMWGACVDPEVMKLVVAEAVAERGVRVLVGSGVTDAVMDGDRLAAVEVQAKRGRILVGGDVFIDASGDADPAVFAGVPTEMGSPQGALQPVSLTFRMSHIDFGRYVDWFRAHPDQFNLAENPAFGMSRDEAAQAVFESGLPFCVLQGQGTGTLLADAIASGDMYPTTAIWMWPTSIGRGEMGFNTTRVSGVDGTNSEAMGRAGATLAGQVQQAVTFLSGSVPGFENAHLSGVAPKVGVRETRRVRGEDTLTTDAVIGGLKRADGVARGAHHVDLHGAGTEQVRTYVRDGRSYDIPYGSLVPVGVANLLVAGRCFSSEREANGSARVMGTCLAMGQAVGTAAAMVVENRQEDVRELAVADLRARIAADGGVVDGPD